MTSFSFLAFLPYLLGPRSLNVFEMSSISLRPSNVNSLGAGGASGGAAAGPSRLPSTTASASSSAVALDVAHLSERIFTATLPIAVSLSPSDLPPQPAASGSADASPPPTDLVYYTTIRRCSYLSLHLSEIRENLVDLVTSAPVRDEDLWLSYKGIPLKWHWPVGLLYDHLTLNIAPPYAPTTATDPWPITLHLRNPPHAKLPWPTIAPQPSSSGAGALVELTKQAYMALLKEADFVRNGNTKKVNNLRRGEQDGIWEAVREGDWGKWSGLVEGKLLPAQGSWPAEVGTGATAGGGAQGSAAQGGGPTGGATGAIPNRSSSLFPTSSATSDGAQHEGEDAAPPPAEPATPGTFSGKSNGNSSFSSLPGLKAIPVKIVLQGGTVLQEAVPPLVGGPGSGEQQQQADGAGGNGGGRPLTLGEALHFLLPALFPSTGVEASSASAASEPPSGLPSGSLGIDFSGIDGESTTSRRPSPSSQAAAQPPMAVAVVQGVRVPLEASLTWLSRVMSGAEGW